jgi:hypothetical protein
VPNAAHSQSALTLFDQFIHDVLSNRFNKAILDRWTRLALPDGWLVAGCLFQTVWNLRSGAAAEARIKDYDLFYFDGADLSEDAEQRVQARIDDVLGDLGIVAEAKNQARVHLWYPEHFGHAYPQLHSSKEGIDRFLIPATCVGLRPSEGGWELHAPHGLPLLYEGVLAPNPLTDHRALFEVKARSYRDRWPWLKVSNPAARSSISPT